MKVLVCGEGFHELGREDGAGWLTVFAARLLDTDDTDGWCRIPLRQLPRLPRGCQPKPRGPGLAAVRAYHAARINAQDRVVFAADADTPDAGTWRRLHAELMEGVDRCDQTVVRIHAALPMATSESWLLADPAAWRALGLADTATLPHRPETLWGRRREPDGNHPHHRFARVCAAAEGMADDTEGRARLAGMIDFATLAAACPVSFPPFREGFP